MQKITTKKITTLGLICAMALVSSLLIRFPLVPAVSFLSYDPKDIFIAIGGFLFGPGAAFIVSCIVSPLELLFKGGNFLDVLMNILATSSFVCTAAWIYKKDHTRKGAVIGLAAGVICNLIVMLLWNYIVTPIYFGMERSTIIPMLPFFALFNVLKSGINSCIIYFIYKPVVQALRKSGLVEQSSYKMTSAKSWTGWAVGGAATVIALVLVVLHVI